MTPIQRLLLILAVAGCAAPEPLPRDYGVEVFAEDTVTARLMVTTSGTLQVQLRGDNFKVRPDRSFEITTPAWLVVQRGVGTATITSLDGHRLAAVPIGTPTDSTDAKTVLGVRVYVTRLGGERGRIRLAAE
jgi:hypothetical protein